MDEKERIELVVKDYGGILPYCEIFYLTFLKSRLDAALDCQAHFLRFCANRDHEPAVLWLMQTLSHASAVSRFLWPPRSKRKLHAARAEKLRRGLGVETDSPLNDRSLRDTLEHFDERLDKYFLGDLAGSLFPFLVDDHDPRSDGPCHLIAYINPRQSYVVILDQQYEYGALFLELLSLKKKIDLAYQNSRLPVPNANQS